MPDSADFSQLALYPRYAKRVRLRFAAFLPLLAQGLVTRQSVEACFAALTKLEYELDLSAKLRIVRALVLERLCALDVSGQANLQSITEAMTQLAVWALDLAGRSIYQELAMTHGNPVDAQGKPSPLWAVGMGKLGASELNVSSDIDLVFVYAADGQTLGKNSNSTISNGEFYQKWARATSQLLSDVTEYGFVFRVDLALRPHGGSGATALSLESLGKYLQQSARAWERFAWLKARVLTCYGGDSELDAVQKAQIQLQTLVHPFVFRQHLDFALMQSLRELMLQIRDHSQQRASGRSEPLLDVKLSRGGIRELEFSLQLQQIMRGGLWPELRVRGTLEALEALLKAQTVDAETTCALHQANDFLRRTEHRIQYLDDQQTHYLPRNQEDQAWLAKSMGFATDAKFLETLNKHRKRVEQYFDSVLGNADQGAIKIETNQNNSALSDWLFDFKSQLTENKLLQIQTIFAQTSARLHKGEISLYCIAPFLDFLESILRKDTYLALLSEHPAVLLSLQQSLVSGRWMRRYLMRNPTVLDEFLRPENADPRFDSMRFKNELLARRAHLQSLGLDDEESLMAMLRIAQQREIFRCLIREQKQGLSVEQVSDDLSSLADCILQICLDWAWDFIKERHVSVASVVLIGYGKLGSKELGYGSDLDLVCLYDDAHENASANYAKLLRKIISWLSLYTPQGRVYEIDTALRPNGNSGLLVSSIEAFENYQVQRSSTNASNRAWVWEHQAMTRARCVAATSASIVLAQRFEAVRNQVLCAPRDKTRLQTEIVQMRERMAAAQKSLEDGMFDPKHSSGGMIDLEFCVQFLILLHSAKNSALQLNIGNMALLRAAGQAGLLDEKIAEDAALAYRTLRQAQHTAHLNETTMPIGLTPQLHTTRDAVLRLWSALF